MPETMKAVDVRGGAGPASALFINAETPRPTPGAGQVLVKVSAFGLNRMDLLQREGKYPLPPQAPKTLGVEFSGVIESLGDFSASASTDADGIPFKKGDAVFGLAYGGAYAEYIAVSARMLMHKPAGLTHEQAAGIPETFITATQALHLVGGFAKGDRVLWHAGASGVSIAGAQLARRAGAGAVFSTAGSDDKCAFLREELGVDGAFNYKTQDWAEEVRRATGGRGVDLIVDFVGADYFSKNMDAAAQEGRIVCLGLLSGAVVKEVNVAQLLFKRLRIEGSTLRARDEEYQGMLRDRLEECLPQFETGELKVFVDKVLSWEQIQEAHELLEKNVTRGKIICTIP
ncbi:zinc-binding alcohol dehydrogenase domain-containing protein 2 [Pyricularia oryzae]|nr:zinc-binding alcohol dehydrogenase domain-containing protein 2 [Pyricularia oryzae]